MGLLKRLALVGDRTLHSFNHSICLFSADAPPSENGNLLPRDALDNIVAISAADSGNVPSLRALQTHVADLEQEIRDVDFRLHFLYRQRLANIEKLNAAKSSMDRFKV